MKISKEIIGFIDDLGIKQVDVENLDLDYITVSELFMAILLRSRNLEHSYSFLDKYFDFVDFEYLIKTYEEFNAFLITINKERFQKEVYVSLYLKAMYGLIINIDSKAKFKQQIIEVLKKISKFNYQDNCNKLVHEQAVFINSVLYILGEIGISDNSNFASVLIELFFVSFKSYNYDRSYFSIKGFENISYQNEIKYLLMSLINLLEEKEYQENTLLEIYEIAAKIKESYFLDRDIFIYNLYNELVYNIIKSIDYENNEDIFLYDIAQITRIEYLIKNRKNDLKENRSLRMTFLADVDEIRTLFNTNVKEIFKDANSKELLKNIKIGLNNAGLNRFYKDFYKFNKKIVNIIEEYFIEESQYLISNCITYAYNDLYELYVNYEKTFSYVYQTVSSQPGNILGDYYEVITDVSVLLDEIKELLTEQNIFKINLFDKNNIDFIEELKTINHINNKSNSSDHELENSSVTTNEEYYFKTVMQELRGIAESKYYKYKYKPLSADEIEKKINVLYNKDYDWIKLLMQAEHLINDYHGKSHEVYDWSFIYILYAKAIENLIANFIEISLKNNKQYHISKKNPPHRIDIRHSNWRVNFTMKELQNVISDEIAPFYKGFNDIGLFNRRIGYLFKLDRNKFLHKEILQERDQLVHMHKDSIYQLVYIIISIV